MAALLPAAPTLLMDLLRACEPWSPRVPRVSTDAETLNYLADLLTQPH
jgi:hypothetical protein